ncbi:MAG: amphi-Trp domain-containing protein [Desulfatirhabdiaceae bacterium]
MSDIDKFDHESIQDRQSIQQYFNTLIDGLEKGRIIFASGKDSLLLTPAELIRFSVKTKKKQGKSKLTIKLVWNDSILHQTQDKGNAIQIAS